MNKSQSQQQLQQLQHPEKPCFATKEWSKTSGICRGCELKEDCGKVKAQKE